MRKRIRLGGAPMRDRGYRDPSPFATLRVGISDSSYRMYRDRSWSFTMSTSIFLT